MSFDLVAGDCRDASLYSGSFDLAIADPPYNFGQNYAQYRDRLSRDEYLGFSRDWLATVCGALSPTGSLFVFLPPHWVSRVEILLQDEIGMHYRNHIVWVYSFGQHQRTKFSPAHCHILYYVKDPKRFHFDPKAVAVPSARQTVYGDKRAAAGGRTPDDVWILDPRRLDAELSATADVVVANRICGTFRERNSTSPNQLPLPVVTRIILATTRPGDRVVDPFLGSGSSAIACRRTGRNYLGIDISPQCVAAAKLRLEKDQEHECDRETKPSGRQQKVRRLSKKAKASD